MSELTAEQRLAEAEKLIAEIYRFSGTSNQIDYGLWRKTKAYCERHKLADVQELEIEV